MWLEFYPFNRAIFTNDDYLTSFVTNRPAPLQQEINIAAVSTNMDHSASCTDLTNTLVTLAKKDESSRTPTVFISLEEILGLPKAASRKLT